MAVSDDLAFAADEFRQLAEFFESEGNSVFGNMIRAAEARMRCAVALEAAEAVRGGDGAPPAGVTISRALLSEVLRKLRPLASHPDEKPAKMTEDDVLAAKQVYSALKAVEDRATASSATPPAGTVAAERSCCGCAHWHHDFEDGGYCFGVPPMMPTRENESKSFPFTRATDRCPKWAPAPLPAVPEVGAVVEGVDRG